VARYDTDGFGRCAIVLRATGKLVGDCGLIRTTVESVSEVELGWVVRRSHRGLGIATEAAAAWRDYAFAVLALERIVSMVAAENIASRRVAEKLGMTVERPAVWGGLPMLMYSCACDQSRSAAAGREGRCPNPLRDKERRRPKATRRIGTSR